MQSSPSLNLSEMIMYMRNWIESDPVITLNETTLRIDGNCDIEIIQGPECGAGTSPSTATDGTSDSSGGGSGTEEPPSVSGGSQSQGPIIAGSILIVVAVIAISLAVAVTLFILVRYRIVKCDTYNM